MSGYNLDRTFCQGLRCEKANTCERWIENLVAWAESRKFNLQDRRISIAQYADHDGKCTAYEPKERK